MKVYISNNKTYTAPIHYVLQLIAKNLGNSFVFVDNAGDAELIFDDVLSTSQPLALHFYNELSVDKPDLSYKTLFTDSQFIHTEKGAIDYLATIFYMVNAMQEKNPAGDALDDYGRFRYEASFQKSFNSIEHNLVQQTIDSLAKAWNIKDAHTFKSAWFLSHDVDNLYGSLLQDGYWALKKGRIDIILRIIANEFGRKPEWRNIDKIIQLNSEYDVKSTFFWLVNKGKGELNIKNADYDIAKEKDLIALAQKNGFVNGLHKSCSATTFDEEMAKHPSKPVCNRSHFLRFLPHTDWPKMEDAGIAFDSSLGYAERVGFRNSYGMPFQPYDLRKKKAFALVEAPMNFMDGTMHKYMDTPIEEVADRMIKFYEANNKNCIFGVCWHNNYFTNYKFHGYLDQYKKMMAFIYENKIECLTPEEVIKRVKIVS